MKAYTWGLRVLFIGGLWVSVALAQPATQEIKAGRTTLLEMYGKLPLSFIPNQSQTAPQVAFTVRSLGGTLFFTPEEIVLALRMGEENAPAPVLRMQFVGANQITSIGGQERLPGTANYFLGNDPDRWQTNLPTYARVTYTNLYPGIDLHYDGHDGRLKGTYLVAPGSDPAQIRWQYTGAKEVWIEPESGDLLIAVATGNTPHVLREDAPVAWQETGGQRLPVEVCYTLGVDHRVGFVVGYYDPALPLVIDPVTLIYSTYLGGSSDEVAYDIAVDGSGHAYVTGSTISTDFPTQNPFQTVQGDDDVFITKFTAAGNALVYSTYLGGSGSEGSYDIAVDGSGQASVIGETYSPDFPTQNPYDATLGGEADAFVAKLTSAGNGLVYSTYLGGSGGEDGLGIAVDGSGQVYVTGSTTSTDFPTQNPYQSSLQGNGDAFVTKFTVAGNALSYSTYLGGSGGDGGGSIAVDGSGQAYLTGGTWSTDFPTQNPYQSTHGGSLNDVFVTKLTVAGSSLIYSTYLGGSGDDGSFGIAVDGSGLVYVTGYTLSTDFPTQNPYQSSKQGEQDAFVTKLSAAGSSLVYSTYLGGSRSDFGLDIAVDGNGQVYVTGSTGSTDFPTQNPYQSSLQGNGDAFVTKFTVAGNALSYSTYLGGTGGDGCLSIAVDSNGQVYLTGWTASVDFPTQNPYQSSKQGGQDAFVTKLTFSSEQNENSYLLWTR